MGVRFGENLEHKPILIKKSFICGLIISFPVSLYIGLVNIPIIDILLLSICFSGQLSAALMDERYKEVYDLYHISSGLSLILLFIFGSIRWKDISIVGFAIFAAFQILMAFTYGLSDMFAFDIMGLLTAYAFFPLNSGQPTIMMNAWNYLLYALGSMLLCYIIFFLLQLKNKNINHFGNCKEKAAFIPSIYMVDVLMFGVAAFINLKKG